MQRENLDIVVFQKTSSLIDWTKACDTMTCKNVQLDVRLIMKTLHTILEFITLYLISFGNITLSFCKEHRGWSCKDWRQKEQLTKVRLKIRQWPWLWKREIGELLWKDVYYILSIVATRINSLYRSINSSRFFPFFS